MSDNGKTLSREDILAVDDRKRERVEVPEWGGAVHLQEMSGTERDAFEASMIRVRQNGNEARAEPTFENARAKLLVRCIVEEDGSRMFSDKEISLLGGRSAKALDRLYDRARELNGIGEDDIEELVGNSGGDHSDTSSSSSVSASDAPTQTTSTGN